MILYDEVMGNLNIYLAQANKQDLIEYKKKHLNEIKSAILHIQDKTEDLLFWKNAIDFSELDKINEDTYSTINFIELTNSEQLKKNYIEGIYDNYKAIDIKCDDYNEMGRSSNLKNDNYKLLFKGGVKTDFGFISYESVLLSGCLAYQQNIINGTLDYYDSYLVDEELLKIINLKLLGSIRLNDLVFSESIGLVKMDKSLDDKIEKSYSLLRLINK